MITRLDTFLRLLKFKDCESFTCKQFGKDSQSKFWFDNVRNGVLIRISKGHYKLSNECKSFIKSKLEVLDKLRKITQ